MARKRSEQNEEPGTGGRSKLLIAAVVVVILLAGGGAGVGMNFWLSDALPGAKSTAVKTTPRAVTTLPSSAMASSGANIANSSGDRTAGFDASRAMANVQALADQIGSRPAGSGKEATAANFVTQKLAEYGYTVDEQAFTTPDGFGTRNVIGTRRGSKEGYSILVAAHYDSSAATKGAVDDASGVGTVLELARVFATDQLQPTLKFVFFGANRPGAGALASRLLGARRYVDLLGTLDRKDVVGVIEVDCVAAGQYLALRTQETGLQRLKDKMATYAKESDLPAVTLKGTDDSDNMPFEDAKIPAVWIEWCDAGGQVNADDNSSASVQAPKVEAAGKFVESFLRDLTSDDLEELKY